MLSKNGTAAAASANLDITIAAAKTTMAAKAFARIALIAQDGHAAETSAPSVHAQALPSRSNAC